MQKRYRNSKARQSTSIKKRHHYAGIYLIGYSVEMWLKTAYFRLMDATANDLIEPQLAPAALRGKRELHPPVSDTDREGYHNLLLWARLIEHERSNPNPPFPRAPFETYFAFDLQSVAQRLHENWLVQMRYRKPIVATKEAEMSLKDAGWIRTNYDKLWS